jgi:hypothetical protein
MLLTSKTLMFKTKITIRFTFQTKSTREPKYILILSTINKALSVKAETGAKIKAKSQKRYLQLNKIKIKILIKTLFKNLLEAD